MVIPAETCSSLNRLGDVAHLECTPFCLFQSKILHTKFESLEPYYPRTSWRSEWGEIFISYSFPPFPSPLDQIEFVPTNRHPLAFRSYLLLVLYRIYTRQHVVQKDVNLVLAVCSFCYLFSPSVHHSLSVSIAKKDCKTEFRPRALGFLLANK